jgi:hypothetical protein
MHLMLERQTKPKMIDKLLSESVERKFTDSLDISDYEIEGEFGWTDISHINKTIEYEKYILITENCRLECADNHIVFLANGSQIFVKDLIFGDLICGENGYEKVITAYPTKIYEEMFDLSVGGNNTYYANGLLHHNTTVAAAFFVWYILFNDDKSVAVLANKQATADEIMSRIKMAYENLPKWLQNGIKTWNKRTIELENGSKCFGAATSSSGIRGKTINILYLDEMGFIPNNQAEDFFTSVYPTITASTESRVIITSTPNGFNAFYKFWNEAEKKTNGFIPYSALWHQIPGRNQLWYEEQKNILGPLKTAQELEACLGGDSVVCLLDIETGKIAESTLANLHDIYTKSCAVKEEENDQTIYIPNRMERFAKILLRS